MSDTSASSTLPSGELPVSEQDVRAELEKLLADPNFRATDRNRRFLRYVTEKLLEGNAHRVKAYSIAVDVFGRPKDFDPTLDPIVRIEATRLRTSLAHYYEAHAVGRELRIELPKGGYQPVIVRHRPADAPLSPELPFSEKPRLRIKLLAGDARLAARAQEVREALTADLSRFQTLRLLTEAAEEREGVSSPAPVRTGAGAFELLLTYRTREQGDLLCWQLLDLPAQEVVASGREIIEVEGDPARPGCAARMANRIGGWQGLISNRELRRDLAEPTLGHGSLLRAFHALRTGDLPAIEEARQGLEISIGSRPGDAELRATLALLLLASDAQQDAELQAALTLTESATALSPYSALAARAQMIALSRLDQGEAARLAGQRALDLNPNDRELLTIVGELLCIAGNWNDGIPFLERARSLDNSADLRSALTLSAWHRGALEEARSYLEQGRLDYTCASA